MSDLDNEEYEATKSLKEKSADEMFGELGYRKLNRNEIKTDNYCNKNKNIQFWRDKTISAIIINEDNKSIDYSFISMQELKAIYKYCKEKGWLDE